jgi:hypothetical protein
VAHPATATLLLAALTACSGTAVDQLSSPTTPPAAGATVVREGDSGTTLRVPVGQRIRVVLTDGTWDPPVSSTASVVRRSSTGGYPSDQPVDAVFEAVTAGTADLSTSTDAACFHTEPRCLMPTRLWQVHVVVG